MNPPPIQRSETREVEERAATAAMRFAQQKLRIADRMVETVTEHGNSLRHTVTLTLSQAILVGGATNVVPLLILPRRQRLLDGFDAQTSDGQPLQILSRERGRALLRTVIDAAWALTVPDMTGSDDIHDKLKGIRGAILAHTPGEDVVAALQAKGRALHELAQLLKDRIDVDAFSDLADVTGFFTANYVLWADLPADAPPLVRYSYLEPLEQRASLRSINGLRAFLGLSPYRVEFPVRLPGRPASYHLRLEAPDSHYVYLAGFASESQFNLEGSAAARGTGSEQHGMASFDTLADEEGIHYEGVARASHRSHAHLYLHGALEKLPARFQALIIFRQLPPGSFGPVSWLLTLQSLLLLAILPRHDELGVSGAGVGLAAVLVTLPAIAAGFIGHTLSRDELLRAPVLARAGLWLSACVSVWSVIHLLLLRTSNAQTECRGAFAAWPGWLCPKGQDTPTLTTRMADKLAGPAPLLLAWGVVTLGAVALWWRRFMSHQAYHHPPVGGSTARAWLLAARRMRTWLSRILAGNTRGIIRP